MQCSAYSDGLELVSAYLGGVRRHTSWRTLFPELETAGAAAGTAEDSEDDSDFAPEQSELASSGSESESGTSSESEQQSDRYAPNEGLDGGGSGSECEGGGGEVKNGGCGVLQRLLERGSPPPPATMRRRRNSGKDSGAMQSHDSAGRDEECSGGGDGGVSLAQWYHGDWPDGNDGDDEEYRPVQPRRKRAKSTTGGEEAVSVQEDASAASSSSVRAGDHSDEQAVNPAAVTGPAVAVAAVNGQINSGRPRRGAAARAMDWFASLPPAP